MGGSSGPGINYRSYVRPDGSRLYPSLFLVRRRAVTQYQAMYSVMSIEDALDTDTTKKVDGEDALQIAKSALAKFQGEQLAEFLDLKVRFHDQSLLNFKVSS